MLNSLVDLWGVIQYPLGGVLCLGGAILCIIGTIGALRFPDFYTRLHATSVTDTGGSSLLLLGMLVLAPSPAVAVKVFAVWALLFLTSPTSAHAVANAAHTAGLEPLIGDLSATNELEEETVNG